jgi:hypothetical protein
MMMKSRREPWFAENDVRSILIRFMDDSAIALFSGFSGRGAKYIPHAAHLFAAQLSERLL